MRVKKTAATITLIQDLSKTAKDVTLALTEQLDFTAGHFVNLFMDINGESVRRAFSISSSDADQSKITLSIRHSLDGIVSPLFWKDDLTGARVTLMGPLGINTGDKMSAPNAYLFAYGVGVGVVKSILDHVMRAKRATRVVVMTGSRLEEEILHKEFFNAIAYTNPWVEVRHVVSQPVTSSQVLQGYIQDHITDLDFNNADVYVCGQKIACDSLVKEIQKNSPTNCTFFIEAFH